MDEEAPVSQWSLSGPGMRASGAGIRRFVSFQRTVTRRTDTMSSRGKDGMMGAVLTCMKFSDREEDDYIFLSLRGTRCT